MRASRALQEVREMKQAAHEETKHLTGAAYFEYVHRQVQRLLPAGMALPQVDGVRHAAADLAVAEAAAPYRTGAHKP